MTLDPTSNDMARGRMTARLIDSLYVEAMVLADEARAYFDNQGRDERRALDPMLRVGFSCESLKVTTRLMHIVGWLMAHRAIEAGDMAGNAEIRRLGEAGTSDADLLAQLPEAARQLVEASEELYARVRRLDEGGAAAEPQASPARTLLSRLERSL